MILRSLDDDILEQQRTSGSSGGWSASVYQQLASEREKEREEGGMGERDYNLLKPLTSH
jgi:hypothetical protein